LRHWGIIGIVIVLYCILYFYEVRYLTEVINSRLDHWFFFFPHSLSARLPFFPMRKKDGMCCLFVRVPPPAAPQPPCF